MVAIQKAIQEGASAYLARQNKTVLWVGIQRFNNLESAWPSIAVGLLLCCLICLAGYIGMMVAVRANARVAQGGQTCLKARL